MGSCSIIRATDVLEFCVNLTQSEQVLLVQIFRHFDCGNNFEISDFRERLMLM